jgi:lysozyme family protein
VPKGRPKTGNPPFQWEFSAKDALNYDKMGQVRWGSLDAMLYAVERYNGTGYLRYHPTVPTPYIWSYTSIYTRGKYVADGKWSSTAVSAQIGVGAILKRMEARGIIKMPR